MKFLGGFLKFLGILLLLIGTAGATALIIFGIMDEQVEPIWVGAGVFLAFLFVSLGVLGTGTALKQLANLKLRVAQLEQRLWNAPVPAPAKVEEPVVIPAPVAEMKAEETPIAAAPAAPVPVTPEPAKKKSKTWLPIAIGAVLAIAAIVIVAVSGGKKPAENIPMEAPHYQEIAPVEIAETEATEGPAKIDVVELPMGSSLSTGFVDMTFNEVIIEPDIRKSVTIDRVTRTSGPQPLSGQQYICLSGTIKNTSTAELPVYDFFLGRFQLGDYSYDVTANDCDVLSADGSPESGIAPLMEYEYRIFVAIPDELAEMSKAGEFPISFTFGFYDGFDNQELSYNRSFADDPIAECPYQYFIPFY